MVDSEERTLGSFLDKLLEKKQTLRSNRSRQPRQS
jgi:hypothetical protein